MYRELVCLLEVITYQTLNKVLITICISRDFPFQEVRVVAAQTWRSIKFAVVVKSEISKKGFSLSYQKILWST